VRAAGTLDERLRAHVRPTITLISRQQGPFYAIVEPPTKAIIEEPQVAGEARVECTLPDGSRCVQWNLQTGMFQFLQEEKNADGALLVWRADGTVDGSFDAHVLECKRTVDQRKWADVLQQMRWTLARLLAVAGTLGVPIARARFYTAYRRDLLSSDSSRNPALPRIPIAGGAPPHGELDRARRQQLDWENDDLVMEGFAGRFPHRKGKLDDATGRGAVDLSEG
jgi:hypothetical protein